MRHRQKFATPNRQGLYISGRCAGIVLKQLLCRCCYDITVVLSFPDGLPRPQHLLWGPTAAFVLSPLLVEFSGLKLKR